MAEEKKVLQMTFATAEGGTLKLSIGNTRDDLDNDQVTEAMDDIVMSKVFETNKGSVTSKVKACFVTTQIQELDIN